jgi:hypothetical protein
MSGSGNFPDRPQPWAAFPRTELQRCAFSTIPGVSKIDQYEDSRNGILPLTPLCCSLGRCKAARRESKALYPRRQSVDSNVAVAHLSRVPQIVEAMTQPDRLSFQDPSTLALIRNPNNGHGHSGEKYITITCPECLRTFPQVLGEFICPVHETGCVHCRSLIHLTIVEPSAHAPVSRAVAQRENANAS